MDRKKLLLGSMALGLASFGAHAQSSEDLKRALAQAQAAAEQAQAAARQAQAALDQALAAANEAKRSSASAGTGAVTAQAAPGSGLTISKGSDYAQLYGLIDITLFSRNHVDAAGHHVFSPDVAWFSGNRWGLTGAHGVGQGDLKAIFRLESEFESQTGNMDTPGVLFNRDSWLGLQSSALGKLTFGRQNALGRDPAGSATYGDPYGPAKANLDEGGYTNTNNFKQLIFYSGSATGTRLDRGVVWKKDWSGLVSGLAYQFGGVPGSFGRNTTRTASLAYNGPSFTIAGFATDADVSSLKHKTESIGGNVQLSSLVRVNAGLFHYTAELGNGLGTRTDNAWTLSTKLTPSKAWDYELGYQVMSAKNAGLTGKGFVQNAFADTSGVTAVATGKKRTVYASVFYHLDAQTEIYLAADQMKTTAGYKDSRAAGFDSQTELGLGMRYRF